MDHRMIDALMEGIAPVIKEYVANVFESIVERLSALEQLKPEKGDPGERGEKGLDGKDGAPIKGDKGDPGADGKDGASIKGDKGDPGADGKDGASIKGDKGDPGADGKDGESGERGPAGEKGLDGKNGAPGVNGKDGTPAELAVAPDDVAELIAKAIALVAESPPISAKAEPIVMNISAPAERAAKPSSKRITTRRDKDGNLVADIVETNN